MCTCMTFKTKDYYFGRNLDLESTFGEKVIITPRNYEFTLKNKTKMKKTPQNSREELINQTQKLLKSNGYEKNSNHYNERKGFGQGRHHS